MEHKCVNCGFLTIRNKDNYQLEEVKREVTGLIRDKQFVFLNSRNIQPLCFLNQVNLPFAYNELQMSRETLIDNETKIDIVLKKNGCELYREYQQGFTPKERGEMMDREWMQKHLEDREDSQRPPQRSGI